MSRTKSNKNITIEKDNTKSYIFIKDKGEDIGILMWHYKKHKWVFDDSQMQSKG